ncbi:phosphoribosylformylglycinamidine synthase subunit PurQ, partial [uncultured Arcanobacterium sp.]|uniref:phosphoribosylformylglycinamidine synthase subunit PurQ n=1 Tax=uncultured Arcanobacterium sp. TaxID=487520 RepID=UPI0026077FE2
NSDFAVETGFAPICGGFLLEAAADFSPHPAVEELVEIQEIGEVISPYELRAAGEKVAIAELQKGYEAKLEPVYHVHTPATDAGSGADSSSAADSLADSLAPVNSTPALRPDIQSYPWIKNTLPARKYSGQPHPNPRVLIPVFPGTNCEFDTARAWEKAGAKADIMVVKSLTVADIERSISDFATKLAKAQILFIPGGFSGGDEPDGSAKFITSFMRNEQVAEEINQLLEKRDGLIGGICNGFQALIKLGLLPAGRICEPKADMPTLTYNTIERHQSGIVNVRICNTSSPWLQKTEMGAIYQVPISHGEGRIVGEVKAQNIATQYVDLAGTPTSDIRFNPNDSQLAIEGMVSDCGRIFGKMGHAERFSAGTYQNVPGRYDMQIFAAAVDYFRS